MAYGGTRAYFALDSSIDVLTNISTYLDGVQLGDSTEELDGTTFQPGVAEPVKDVVGGFSEKSITLSSKWTPTSGTFFYSIRRLTGLDYQYGPLGNTAGMPKIYGLCNHISNSGPDASVGSIIPMTVNLKATSQTLSTF
jgi:hypothetical protein